MSSETATAEPFVRRKEQVLHAIAQTKWSDAACAEALGAVIEAAHGHAEEQRILALVASLRSSIQQLCATAFAHTQQAITWSGANRRVSYDQIVVPLEEKCSAIRARINTFFQELFCLLLDNEEGHFAVDAVGECIRAAEDDQRGFATAAMRDVGAVKSVVVMDPDVLRQLGRNCGDSVPETDSVGGPEDEDPRTSGPNGLFERA